MCYGLRDRQEPVNIRVDGIRKELPGQRVGGGPVFGHKRDHFLLSFIDRSHIAVKYLFKIVNRFAVAAIGQGRRQSPQPGETNKILCERTKALRRIERVG